jgi:hypothetical protein
MMISFRRPEDVVPSFLILLSLLILAGTLAYMIFVPKPRVTGSTGLSARTKRRMVDDIALTRKQERVASASIRPRLWHSDPQSVTATVLEQMTSLAGQHSSKLTAFRPERSQPFESVTELRFDAQLTGTYPGIRAIMAALDARGSKIVLRAVQVASSQEADNTVTATLGLSGYIASDPALTPAPAPSSKPNNSEKRNAHG